MSSCISQKVWALGSWGSELIALSSSVIHRTPLAIGLMIQLCTRSTLFTPPFSGRRPALNPPPPSSHRWMTLMTTAPQFRILLLCPVIWKGKLRVLWKCPPLPQLHPHFLLHPPSLPHLLILPMSDACPSTLSQPILVHMAVARR